MLVVLAHSSRMYTGDGVVYPLNESTALSALTKLIYAFHMPLFIAISGMVYGLCIDDLDKYKDTVQFLKNKTIRLIIPYLFFGMFYVAPTMVLLRFTSETYLQYCYSGIMLVHNSRHLWYIIVLFEIFIISALSKPLLQKKSIVSSIIILLLLIGLSYFSYMLPGVFQISTLAKYLMFFYLGFLLNRYYFLAVKVIKHPVFIAFSMIVFLLVFMRTGWIATAIKAIAGSLVIIGITVYVPQKFMDINFCAEANKNGFGIYLFHPMIIYVLYYYLGQADIAPFVLFIGITIVSYFSSWLFTVMFRNMHLSLLIGE